MAWLRGQRLTKMSDGAYHRFFNLYTKTGLLMCLTFLLGFVLLTLSYYNILATSINRTRLSEMQKAAQSFEDLCVDEHIYQVSDLYRIKDKIIDRLKIVAATTNNSYVWLIDGSGEIRFMSDMPETLKTSLSRSLNSHNYILPHKQSGAELTLQGANFDNGYGGLFKGEKGKWLSTVKPIYNYYGSNLGILQIHQRTDFWQDVTLYLINGWLITLIIAIIVALIVIFAFIHQLSRPMRALAAAAHAVALGDFETRVNLPEYMSSKNEDEYERDDLSNLIMTFNQMIEQLEHNNSQQRDFIASISHDLKTPLTSINGFVSGMLDGVITPEQHEHYLKIVKSECARMVKLVGEINTVIQLENNKVQYNFGEFDINSLIKEVILSQEIQINEKKLTIQTDLATKEGNGIKVVGDREQLQRVLQNLLNNAVKFTPESGIISISTILPKGQKRFVQVQVADSGPGIPDNELNLVFDRFYKADRSRTGRSGSGLGLFICKTILSAHGQTISAQNGSLGGACFKFTLPLT